MAQYFTQVTFRSLSFWLCDDKVITQSYGIIINNYIITIFFSFYQQSISVWKWRTIETWPNCRLLRSSRFSIRLINRCNQARNKRTSSSKRGGRWTVDKTGADGCWSRQNKVWTSFCSAAAPPLFNATLKDNWRQTFKGTLTSAEFCCLWPTQEDVRGGVFARTLFIHVSGVGENTKVATRWQFIYRLTL